MLNIMIAQAIKITIKSDSYKEYIGIKNMAQKR